MEKKTIIGALIAIIAIGGLAWWGRSVIPNETSTPSGQQSVSALAAAETSYNFGRISMKDGLVEKTFAVTNTSSKDLLIERISTSCMCTTAFITTADGKEKGPYGMVGHGVSSVPKANEAIKAGETRAVRVIFDPNAHGPAGVGVIERVVMLEDSMGGRFDLAISATVTP